MDYLTETYGDSIAIIRYHGWWPGPTDPFWLHNQPDSQTRIYYLNAHQANPGDGLYAPHVFFDGHFDAHSTYNQYENVLLQAMAVPGYIDLSLDVDLDFANELIYVTCEGLPEQAIPGTLHLRYGVTESNLRTPDGRRWDQVMRDMVPDPDGVTLDLSTGAAFQDEQTIPVHPAWTLHNLEIIAFVQEDVNAEVFQTVKASMPRELPLFRIGDVHIVESGDGGDDDGVLNPGEQGTISLFLTADEEWGAATDLSLTLATESEHVTILSGETSVAQLEPGDTTWVTGDEFVITVAAAAGMGSFPMDLVVEATWGDDQWYQQRLPFDVLVSMNQFGFPVLASGEIMSSPAIFDMDGEPYIAVADESGSVYVLDGAGMPLNGFPVQAGDRASSSPVVVDVDQDGSLEIIVGSWDKSLYCFGMDGSVEWSTDLGGYVTGPAAVADVDGDGGLEVVAGTMSADLWVLDETGAPQSGWPVEFSSSHRMSAGVCLVDFEGDGAREIVVGTWGKEIHAYHGDGAAVDGWPVVLDDQIKGGIVAAPLAGSGIALVVPCSDNKMYVFDIGGELLGTVLTEGEILSTPAVSDLNGDMMAEIVVASANGYIHVVDSMLQELSGWPVSIGERVETSPVVADLDGDGSAEILLGSDDGYLHVLGTDATTFVEPLPLEERIRSTPALADLDNDGDIDLVVGAGSELVGLDFKNAGGSVDGFWRQYRAVPERTGWLLDLGAVSAPQAVIPSSLQLHAPFPNPGSSQMYVRFDLPEAGTVELAVYDLSGRLVQRVLTGGFEAGSHLSRVSVADLSNGVYFIGLTAPCGTSRKPMVVIR